eukprot:Sdes_comp18586_c0_seq1m8724
MDPSEKNLNQKKKKKLLFIGVDGVRTDCLLSCQSKNIVSWSSESLYSFWGETCPQTISGPSWSCILTGYYNHKITDNNFLKSSSNLKNCPSIFTTLKSELPHLETAAVYSWQGIESILNPKSIDYNWKVESDEEATLKIQNLLREEVCPDVLFYYLNDCDEYGHKHGFHLFGKEYLQAIEKSDQNVATIRNIIQSRESNHNEQWCVICTTDHGGVNRDVLSRDLTKKFSEIDTLSSTPHDPTYKGIHGLDLPMIRTIFFFAYESHSQKAREILPPPRAVDIAATVLSFFEVQNKQMDGVSIHSADFGSMARRNE